MSDTQYRDLRDARIEMLELRVEQLEDNIRELRCPAELEPQEIRAAERESERDPGDMTAACEQLREIIEPDQEQAEAERKAAAEEVAPGIADTEMVMLRKGFLDGAIERLEELGYPDNAGLLKWAARPARIDEEELREELAERGMDSSWHLPVCDCLRKMGWL
jgi:hypothetical protein